MSVLATLGVSEYEFCMNYIGTSISYIECRECGDFRFILDGIHDCSCFHAVLPVLKTRLISRIIYPELREKIREIVMNSENNISLGYRDTKGKLYYKSKNGEIVSVYDSTDKIATPVFTSPLHVFAVSNE